MMQHDDFSKYHVLRRKGASSAEVYRQAKADGEDEIACFRLLREVFDLTLVDAKRIIVVANGQVDSLEEHQENLRSGLARVLQDLEGQRK